MVWFVFRPRITLSTYTKLSGTFHIAWIRVWMIGWSLNIRDTFDRKSIVREALFQGPILNPFLDNAACSMTSRAQKEEASPWMSSEVEGFFCWEGQKTLMGYGKVDKCCKTCRVTGNSKKIGKFKYLWTKLKLPNALQIQPLASLFGTDIKGPLSGEEGKSKGAGSNCRNLVPEDFFFWAMTVQTYIFLLSFFCERTFCFEASTHFLG